MITFHISSTCRCDRLKSNMLCRQTKTAQPLLCTASAHCSCNNRTVNTTNYMRHWHIYTLSRVFKLYKYTCTRRGNTSTQTTTHTIWFKNSTHANIPPWSARRKGIERERERDWDRHNHHNEMYTCLNCNTISFECFCCVCTICLVCEIYFAYLCVLCCSSIMYEYVQCV